MDVLEKERIVRKNIINLFRENYSSTLNDDEILDTIPPNMDQKDSSFYESVIDIFLLELENESSIRGRVKDTIEKVTKLWSTTPHSLHYV